MEQFEKEQEEIKAAPQIKIRVEISDSEENSPDKAFQKPIYKLPPPRARKEELIQQNIRMNELSKRELKQLQKRNQKMEELVTFS